MAAIAAGVMLAIAVPPAAAHSGGRAQLYVDSVHLDPEPAGWQAELVVRDADSGKPEPGVGVQVTANGAAAPQPIGPIALADPDGDGRYLAVIPLAAGPWTITVKADEIPGGPRALPFSRAWTATLEAGQPLDLGAAASSSAGRGSGGRGPAIAIAGLGLLAAVALVVWRRRRRTWIREAALG